MDELRFRKWLAENGVSKKVQSDCISRLKRIERELNHCDLDEEYQKDRCKLIFGIFSNMGKNEMMAKFLPVNFPIGKYSMNPYKYSLKKYVEFSDCITSANKK